MRQRGAPFRVLLTILVATTATGAPRFVLPVAAQDPTPVKVTRTKGDPTPPPPASPIPALPTDAPSPTPAPSAPPDAVAVPTLQASVTDLSGVVEAMESLQRMADASAYLAQATGSTLTVLFLPTTASEAIAGYAARVLAANPDAIGDYGSLLVVATNDRRAWLATGSGVARSVSQAELDTIWSRDMAPQLAAGDWERTVTHGARGLRAAIQDQPLLDIPTLRTPLLDQAGRVPTESDALGITAAATELLDADGARFTAWTLPSMLGEPPDSVVAAVKDLDPTVLSPFDALLMLADEDQTAHLVLGAGLGARIPDVVQGMVWSRDIRPGLVAGDWAAAVLGAIAGLRSAIERSDLCLLTPEELSDIVGLPFVDAVGSGADCWYTGDPTRGSFAFSLGFGQGMEESSLDAVRRLATTNGQDATVQGFPAWLSDDGIWVDLGEDAGPAADGWDQQYAWESAVLTAQPVFQFLSDAPAPAYLPAVADRALTALLGDQ